MALSWKWVYYIGNGKTHCKFVWVKNPGIDGNGREKKSEQLARKVPSTPFLFLRISGVKSV